MIMELNFKNKYLLYDMMNDPKEKNRDSIT